MCLLLLQELRPVLLGGQLSNVLNWCMHSNAAAAQTLSTGQCTVIELAGADSRRMCADD